MSTGKKVGIGCAGLFVVFMVIGSIGAAVKKERESAEATPAPSPAVASGSIAANSPRPVGLSAQPATSLAPLPTGPANLAVLEKQELATRQSYEPLREQHGYFQIQAKITERSGNKLMLWGKVYGQGGTKQNQEGWLMEDGNIVILDYDKSKIQIDHYYDNAYFLEQKTGKGKLGQKVLVNVYGPAPAALIRAKEAHDAAALKLSEAQGAMADAAKDTKEEAYAEYQARIEQFAKDAAATGLYGIQPTLGRQGQIIAAVWISAKRDIIPKIVLVRDANGPFISVSDSWQPGLSNTGGFDHAESLGTETLPILTKDIAPLIIAAGHLSTEPAVIAKAIMDKFVTATQDRTESKNVPAPAVDIPPFNIDSVPLSARLGAFDGGRQSYELRIMLQK